MCKPQAPAEEDNFPLAEELAWIMHNLPTIRAYCISIY